MESLKLLGFTFALALEVHQDIREEKEEEPCNQKCIQRFPHEIQKDQSDRDGNIDQYVPSFFWHLFAHWKLQSVLSGLMLRNLAIAASGLPLMTSLSSWGPGLPF